MPILNLTVYRYKQPGFGVTFVGAAVPGVPVLWRKCLDLMSDVGHENRNRNGLSIADLHLSPCPLGYQLRGHFRFRSVTLAAFTCENEITRVKGGCRDYQQSLNSGGKTCLRTTSLFTRDLT